MEEQIQQTIVRLADLKHELTIQLDWAQELFQEYVVSKQYPLSERFKVWVEWCQKRHYSCKIDEKDVPLLGRMVQDNEPYEYERHEEHDWLFFLECFEDDCEGKELLNKYNVTLDDVKELLIETNFGSYRHDW